MYYVVHNNKVYTYQGQGSACARAAQLSSKDGQLAVVIPPPGEETRSYYGDNRPGSVGVNLKAPAWAVRKGRI